VEFGQEQATQVNSPRSRDGLERSDLVHFNQENFSLVSLHVRSDPPTWVVCSIVPDKKMRGKSEKKKATARLTRFSWIAGESAPRISL
jgi:hypothetical protein